MEKHHPQSAYTQEAVMPGGGRARSPQSAAYGNQEAALSSVATPRLSSPQSSAAR